MKCSYTIIDRDILCVGVFAPSGRHYRQGKAIQTPMRFKAPAPSLEEQQQQQQQPANGLKAETRTRETNADLEDQGCSSVEQLLCLHSSIQLGSIVAALQLCASTPSTIARTTFTGVALDIMHLYGSVTLCVFLLKRVNSLPLAVHQFSIGVICSFMVVAFLLPIHFCSLAVISAFVMTAVRVDFSALIGSLAVRTLSFSYHSSDSFVSHSSSLVQDFEQVTLWLREPPAKSYSHLQ